MKRTSASAPAPTLEEARAAKPEAQTVFERLGKLVGVGITRIGEGYGLKVNLETDTEAALPREVRGIPVKVEVVGKLQKRL